jgi:branched-chain amino acid transport system substrate-binding protein
MKKLLALGFLALLGFSFAQIKVGGLWNITGDMSSIDDPGSRGMQLAAEEINAAGGVLGQQVELVIIDGKTDQAALTTAASRMVDVDGVVVVGGINDSTLALAAGPVFQDAGVPFVIAGATLPDLTDQIGDFAFQAPFGDDAQSYAIADYALQDLGATTAYMLYDTAYDFTLALRQFFTERFSAGGGEIVLEDSYTSGDKDFSAQITRLQALETPPDVLFVSAVPSDAGNIVQQLRAAGFTQPILSGDGFDTPLLVEVAGEASDDVYFATHVALSNEGEKVANFVAAYTAKYGNAPENAFAALGYDTMYLIADAITRAGSADKTAIRDALAATSGFEAVTGTISYSEGSRKPTKAVTIIHVTGGEFTFAKEVTP